MLSFPSLHSCSDSTQREECCFGMRAIYTSNTDWMRTVGNLFKLSLDSANWQAKLRSFDVERMVGNLVNVRGNFVVFLFLVVILVTVDGKEGMSYRLFLAFAGFILVLTLPPVMGWLARVYTTRGVVIGCCRTNHRITKSADSGESGMLLEGKSIASYRH